MTVRVALGVAYDGAGFHGFAAQPGQVTVQGALVAAITEVLGEVAEVTCAGRTDAGVHALAQVVHADVDRERLEARFGAIPEGGELPALARALSSRCPATVDVWRARVAPPGFDARHGAVGRRYRYDLERGERRNPLVRGFRWHVDAEVDLALLRLGADVVVGEHDFAAFCRQPPDRPSGPIVRRVVEAGWREEAGGVLRFEIEATAFCHQMVRSIVGALVAAGLGRVKPSDLVALLRSGSREGAPPVAPPHGLCLVAVRYPPELGGDWS